jgi:hypothetical protein
MTELDAIHAHGYTGNGQTFAILEGNGSPPLKATLRLSIHFTS